jgi:hypothetical protein
MNTCYGHRMHTEPTATEPATTHRITWWVWAGGEKLRHTSQMRGTWGWDASCTCGWQTRTGGAVKAYVANEVWFHKHIDSDGPQQPVRSYRAMRGA